jgi:hypothetical protein
LRFTVPKGEPPSGRGELSAAGSRGGHRHPVCSRQTAEEPYEEWGKAPAASPRCMSWQIAPIGCRSFPARSRVDAESQLRAAAVPLEDRKGTDSCFDNRLSRQVALPFRRREFAGVASDPKMPGRQYDCIGPRFQILYRISLINTLEIKNVI